jgi:hypothetical protein
MANPERGEVRLEVDGTGYKLQLTMAGIIQLQKEKHKPFGRLIEAVGEIDVEAIVALLWAGFQVHHPRQFKSEQQVLDLIERDGGFGNISKYVNVLTELIALNKPKETETDGNPQPAQSGGTVESSTSTLELTPA